MMGWIEDLNRAMDYIETCLPSEVDTSVVARRAGCSEFHLKRMFPYVTGLTLGDYVRRRRMSWAASELATGARVIDVATMCGYESPTAFSRAFRVVEGASPAQVQRGEATVVQYPRLTFALQVRGAVAMEYRIVDVPAFRVVGHMASGDWSLEDAAEHAEAFWAELVSDGAWRIHNVLGLMDGSEPGGLLGVSFSNGSVFGGYLVGVATSAPCPDGMEERMVEGATYAVFDCVGALPGAMQETWHRVFAEWLPSSGYEWAPKADIELFLGPNLRADDYHGQVWLPIERRRG